MKINRIEFKAMNNSFRRWVQKNTEFKIFKEHLKKRNIDLKNKMILDVGCGSGFSTVLISEEFTPSRLVAFDYMPEQIEIAKKRNLNAEFFVGDATNINIPSETFDAVFVMGVLHHIPEWKIVLQEIHRVLKEDGFLLVEEPTNFLLSVANVLGFEHPKEAKSFCKSLKKSIEQSGFKILLQKIICLCMGESFLCVKQQNKNV